MLFCKNEDACVDANPRQCYEKLTPEGRVKNLLPKWRLDTIQPTWLPACGS
jgi:hypothetical protein